MSLKNDWENTGKELGNAFKGLGKMLVKTIAEGAKKAEEWANEDDFSKKETDEE